MSTTAIEWTDFSWNPIRARNKETGKVGWHCEKVSSGCANCYSERFNMRGLPNGGTGLSYTRDSRDKVEMFLDDRILQQPLHWKKPRKIFVCSMTDLFHESVPDEFIDKVFDVIANSGRHTYQILTKRPERAVQYFKCLAIIWPLPNVWLGVSIENREQTKRIDSLRKCPAAVRFISFEPLLSAITNVDLTGIHWAIVGGESGPKARPCDLKWIEAIVDQCKAASVPVFVKQVGSRPIYDCPAGEENEPQIREDGSARYWKIDYVKNSKGGDINEFPPNLRIREMPNERTNNAR